MGPVTHSQKETENSIQSKDRKTEQTRTNAKPQYKYSTPVEDASLIGKVAKKALDNSITISTHKLLSISPDVCQHIKDLLTTKRVNQTATTAFSEEVKDNSNAEVLMAQSTS